MKKLFTAFVASFFLIPSSFAAEVSLDFFVELELNHIQDFPVVMVKANQDGEITAEHGINIMLDSEQEILWHRDPFDFEIGFMGSAVLNGRVDKNAEVTFSKDYKRLHIPVLEDFQLNEKLEIELLQVRTYNDTFGEQYLELDIDGDFVADAVDENHYEVLDVDNDDDTTPYSIYDVTFEFDENDHLLLSWSNPADYDLNSIEVDKYVTKNGSEVFDSKIYDNLDINVLDDELEGVDEVRYVLTAIDFDGNESEPVEIAVDVISGELLGTTETPDVESGSEAPSDVDEYEFDLDGEGMKIVDPSPYEQRLDYYKLRYQIKCLSASKSDYECLWARIDLIYAQEITGTVLIENLSLSERDLELMTMRRRWPERRYQNLCLNGEVNTDYCKSLEDALGRLSHFLD